MGPDLFNRVQSDAVKPSLCSRHTDQIDRSRMRRKLSLIADTYIEFIATKDGQQQWIKVDKKEILAIVGGRDSCYSPEINTTK